MKEIWINLELYIESYKFSNFRDFSRFFLNLFLIFNVKNNLKIVQKRGLFSCGTHVDATWHSGPRSRATQTHASPFVARM